MGEEFRCAGPKFIQREGAVLDVHPPEHAVSTWREFFIHIATIVIGLLIAIGLEQTVEFFHHRHQVAEVRRSLEEERRDNLRIFQLAVTEWRRYSVRLNENLAVLRDMQSQPGDKANPAQSMALYISVVHFNDSAWTTAQETGVLQYMPRAEVQTWSDYYSRLAEITRSSEAQLDALKAVRTYMLHAQPTLTKAQTEKAFDLMLTLVGEFAFTGNAERRMSRAYPEFRNAPTDAEFYTFFPPWPTAKDKADVTRENSDAGFSTLR